MKSIVDELTIKYRKGRPFFNALDDIIKNKDNRDIILELVKNCENEWIASSGEFGKIIYDLYSDGIFKCKGVVVFNGKMLTNNISVESWIPEEFDLNNKDFIYVDDSYFSGGTVKKIEGFLLNYNSKIKLVNVMYDGSEEKSTLVNSFYRYWDHRDLIEYRRSKY
jgi:hypothetical protein